MSQGIVDEYTLGEKLGYDAAYGVLKPHWDSWVQLGDFQKIQQSGFNLVRIPIGYWAYDNSNSPYVTGAAPYLDAAIDWARQTGLKVIIDLHGAPGSQNGFDNSGQLLPKPLWQQGNTVQQTLAVLETMQTKYGASSYDDVVAGIELLNEPLSSELNFDELKQFERDGFGQQRAVSQSRVVVIQDGFQPPSSYNGFLSPSDNNAYNVALDHHEYQVFTDELVAMQPWQHRQYVCNHASTYTGADKWTFIGEWSAAMTDCAAALNGNYKLSLSLTRYGLTNIGQDMALAHVMTVPIPAAHTSEAAQLSTSSRRGRNRSRTTRGHTSRHSSRRSNPRRTGGSSGTSRPRQAPSGTPSGSLMLASSLNL